MIASYIIHKKNTIKKFGEMAEATLWRQTCSTTSLGVVAIHMNNSIQGKPYSYEERKKEKTSR